MARRKQSNGTCAYCAQTFSSSAIDKHLTVCKNRLENIEKANRKQGIPEDIYHLHVVSIHAPEYWLELEVRGLARLKDLDKYLRVIWLECCGHMSQFSIGGWRGEPIPMSRRLFEESGPETTLTYI